MKPVNQVVFAFVVALLVAAGPARAEVNRRSLMLDSDHGVCDAYLAPGNTTTLYLYSDVVDVHPPEGWGIRLTRGRHTVDLHPPPGTPPDRIAGNLVVTTRAFVLVVTVRPATTKSPADGVIRVDYPRDFDLVEMAAEGRLLAQEKRLDKQHARKMSKEKTRCEKSTHRLQRAYTADLRYVEEYYEEERRLREARHQQEIAALTRQRQVELEQQRLAMEAGQSRKTEQTILTESMRRKKQTYGTPPDGRGLVMWNFRWETFGSYRILHFTLENRYPRALPLAKVEIFDEHRLRDHAGEVKIGDGEPPEGSKESVLATLASGASVDAAVLLHDVETVGREVQLFISEPGGRTPEVSPKVPTWRFTEPPDPNLGVISVGIQGRYGAVWLGNPFEPLKPVDAASIAGLGVRFTYGLLNFLQLEGAVFGASTGDARFPDVEVNGVQGHLLRRAKLGRIEGGLLFRFPRGRTKPFARLGLGVQGLSSATKLDVGGTLMPGPDVAFDLDALFTFGVGLDRRLGDHVVAGIGVSYIDLLESPDRAIEVGVHLSWTERP